MIIDSSRILLQFAYPQQFEDPSIIGWICKRKLRTHWLQIQTVQLSCCLWSFLLDISPSNM